MKKGGFIFVPILILAILLAAVPSLAAQKDTLMVGLNEAYWK